MSLSVGHIFGAVRSSLLDVQYSSRGKQQKLRGATWRACSARPRGAPRVACRVMHLSVVSCVMRVRYRLSLTRVPCACRLSCR